MKNENVVLRLIALGITAVFGFCVYYIALPALNLHSVGFYGYLLALTFCYTLVMLLGSAAIKTKQKRFGSMKIPKEGVVVIAVLFLVMIIGGIASAPLFHAKTYAGIINVESAVFEEDMPETTSVTNIALMDTDSARIIGNRTLGSLSEVVSQYEISEQYSQINYQGKPKKVANLEYVGFFKWSNNNEDGIPGYVEVDPVNNTAEYVKLETPMKYVESAYLGEDLMRKLRFEYPTKLFDEYYFEIDEEGNPYYVVSCLSANAGLFGALDVSEVILFDPCDGSSEIMDVKDVPSWVDIVYSGDLAEEKYNWFGTLSGGFWNSIVGNKDCKTTTDDYGYITIGDDVWYFTGVTSVTSDESNIGFIVTNARTGEYKFYAVVGAEEYSAMGAAEGEVQEKGYSASFPSLVNIGGQATYIMVLKDTGGLVKLYALVNVENYSLVATGENQSAAIANYKKLLRSNEVGVGSDDAKTENITVTDVRVATIEDMPTIYLNDDKGNVYKGYLNSDESLITIQAGDVLTVNYESTGVDRIYFIDSWSFVE